MKTQTKKITSEYADFINHNFGNVVVDGVLKQYIFQEGDDVNDVIEFIKHFYPEKWQDFLDS